MTKLIALAIGMTGTFCGHGQSVGQRAEITHIWSETCVNLLVNDDTGVQKPTSVFVPPLGTPEERLPAGYYFLPDSFIQAAQVEDTTEQAIVTAGADKGPRITPADIEANIVHTEIVKHVSVTGQVLRWAVLTTRNGFAVVGKPSCSVSAANDCAEIGEPIAIENARNELWPLMGYELRSKLATA